MHYLVQMMILIYLHSNRRAWKAYHIVSFKQSELMHSEQGFDASRQALTGILGCQILFARYALVTK